MLRGGPSNPSPQTCIALQQQVVQNSRDGRYILADGVILMLHLAKLKKICWGRGGTCVPFMHPLYFVLGRLVLLGEEVTTRSLAFIDHHSCLRSVRFFFFFFFCSDVLDSVFEPFFRSICFRCAAMLDLARYVLGVVDVTLPGAGKEEQNILVI